MIVTQSTSCMPFEVYNLFSVSSAKNKNLTFQAQKGNFTLMKNFKVLAVGEKTNKLLKKAYMHSNAKEHSGFS